MSEFDAWLVLLGIFCAGVVVGHYSAPRHDRVLVSCAYTYPIGGPEPTGCEIGANMDVCQSENGDLRCRIITDVPSSAR